MSMQFSMSDEESLVPRISEYWTLRSETYSETVNESLNRGEDRQWIDKLSECVDLCRPLKILDVGTGPGFFPMLLGGRGHEVTGIDCTPGMLEVARNNCRERGIKAEFHHMDAHSLDFADGIFDIVISRNVTWNLENPKKAYAEWLRVLKKGGKIVVFDGNHYLQLYDEEFRIATANDYGERGKSRYIGKVDTFVMRDIAEQLPLSKERRPQWDACTLVELGCNSIVIGTERPALIESADDGAVVSVPREFYICASK